MAKKQNNSALLGLAVVGAGVYLFTRQGGQGGGGLVIPPPGEITPGPDQSSLTDYQAQWRVIFEAPSSSVSLTNYQAQWRVIFEAPSPTSVLTNFEAQWRVL